MTQPSSSTGDTRIDSLPAHQTQDLAWTSALHPFHLKEQGTTGTPFEPGEIKARLWRNGEYRWFLFRLVLFGMNQSLVPLRGSPEKNFRD